MTPLNVRKEGSPLRAETGSTPFRRVQVVFGEIKDLTGFREPAQVIDTAPILSQHDSPSWAHRDVIRVLQDLFGGRLENQLELLPFSLILPDLA